MAAKPQIEFLKVLACMAWADDELSRHELHLIGRLMHDLQLSADEQLQVQIYLDERVSLNEARRLTRRFLAHVRRPALRRQLVATVEEVLGYQKERTPAAREWLQELHDAIAESSGSFLIDGLRSLLRLGISQDEASTADREHHLHDFIHNRVLFKLRHRLGATLLESETKPEALKELTLIATFLARVGYVDEEFLPKEKQFIENLLQNLWGISPAIAEAVCGIAMESANGNLDLFRLMQESKATLSIPKRKRLVEASFALAQVEGKMTGAEIEEIRKIAYGLELTHREFINAKLKVLGKEIAT